ncbi:MAG TPA: DNA polymerase III subunit delta [Gemmatimonadaceae bacterium]|nr:DNA polymerase III subunit delta [Gemmatimonadaceae bacterium]
MSAQGLRDLRKAIANRTFEPAYFFHGDDEYRKEAAVRELIAGAVDPATRDFNFDLLRGADVTPEQLASAVNTLPMMADRRVVVLRDVTALKKDARAVLERYLTRPSRDTVLIMTAPAGAKADKGIDHGATTIGFAVLREQELLEWVTRHAQDVHGVTISDRAVALLLSSVGPDAGQMASEVDKLVSYTQGAPIDEEAVAAVVGVRHGESLGDFLDRVAARDAPGALALIEHVLLLPKSGLVPIIIALTVQTLAIGWARQARDRGIAEHRLASELFGLLKETGAYPMRSWSEATECWKKNVSRWDMASVEQALAALLAADRAAKDTKLSSDDQMLASLVCAMCTPARRFAA